MSSRRVSGATVLLIVTLTGTIAGCSAPSSASLPATQTASPSASQAPATPSPTAAALPLTAFDSSVTASDSLPLFDTLALQTISTNPDPHGEDFVSSLIGAGAQASEMQLTSDQTTEGKPVDAIFWSLKIHDECLIGQYHPLELDPEKPKYFSMILAPVGGKCLIGNTLPVTG